MKFNKKQLEAINHYTGNCCVLASAGSGKTSVLIERIKRLIEEHNVEPSNILAITFSRKAATNMKNRLGDKFEEVRIDTFHAMGYKMLREQRCVPYNTQLIKDWEKKQIIVDICVKVLSLNEYEENVDVNNILAFIALQKNNLISCSDQMLKMKKMAFSLEIMKEIYKQYERMKSKKQQIDFDDMIIMTYKMLSSNDKIRNTYQNKFKFILVDEMQDTNKAQYEIIRLLGKTNNNVFVVGDPLQCIYEWRGCDNNYIIEFCNDWADTKVVNLNINYRSTDNIVKMANKLVFGAKETTHKFYLESQANREAYKNPEYVLYADEFTEGMGIGNKITELNSQYQYKQMAILTRTNFQMQAIEMALFHNKIPYHMPEGNTFYEQREIQDMLAFLRLSHDKTNNEAFKRIFNVPNRYLGKVFLEEVSSYAKAKTLSLYQAMLKFPRSTEWRYKKGIAELYSIIHRISSRKKYNVGELIQIIRKDLEYDEYISKEILETDDTDERVENLDTLVAEATKYSSVSEFLSEIDNIGAFRQDEDENKVQIMTIHKSKGLEFPVVFVPSVSEGILPHAKANNKNEEKRLLYVAITRAETELFVSSTAIYNNKIMSESEFLCDIFDKETTTK